MDVSRAEDIKRAVEGFRQKSDHLDVLINNAGILLDKSDIVDLPIQDLMDTLQTNSIGPLIVVQHFLPLMREGGRIINISSQMGALNSMGAGSPAYSISKLH
jgi:NAD(P)-dependent dehydrogenase (short-subunit alcohol dehydrogenase family)